MGAALRADAESWSRTAGLVLLAAMTVAAYAYQYGWRVAAGPFVDAPSFWAASELSFGARSSPYAADFSEAARERVGRHVHPFLYPPPSLLLLHPLSWFSYRRAACVLLVVNHLAIVAICAILVLSLWPRHPPRTWLAAGVGLYATLAMLQATRVTLGHGQLNLLVLLLTLAFWRLLGRRGPDALCALPLATAAVLKVYPLLCLGMPIARRRFGVVAWTAAWVGAWALLSIAALPSGTWSDWTGHVLPTGGYGKALAGIFSPAYPHNASLHGLAARLFADNPYTDAPLHQPTLGTALTYGAALGLVSATFWASLRSARTAPREAPPVELGLYLCAIFLVAPISWTHYGVFVAPAAVLLTVTSWRAGRIHHAVVSGGCLLLLFHDVLPSAGAPASGVVAAALMAPLLYVVLALWATGLDALRRSPPTPPGTAPAD